MQNAENIIFCVGNDREREASFLDFARHAGIPVRPLVGSYKGRQENSFMAPARYASDILPLIHGEESILLLDGPFPENEDDTGEEETAPYAELFYPSTLEEEPLGRFHQVPAAIALKEEAWTLDPATGRYFTCH